MKCICVRAVQKKDKIFPIRTNIEPLGLLCNHGNHISVYYTLFLHSLPLSLAWSAPAHLSRSRFRESIHPNFSYSLYNISGNQLPETSNMPSLEKGFMRKVGHKELYCTYFCFMEDPFSTELTGEINNKGEGKSYYSGLVFSHKSGIKGPVP